MAIYNIDLQRIDELEEEILQFCRELKEMKKPKVKSNYSETENDFIWQFDMSGFAVNNMKLELVQRCVNLRAYRYVHGQVLKIDRTFILPGKADSHLSAKMQANGILTIKAKFK